MSISFLLFPVAIIVMRRFSVNVAFVEVGVEMRKTLMIEKVPRTMCKEIEIRRHFSEAYPSLTVTKVDFAFNVKNLHWIYNELKDARESLRYCNKHDVLDKEQFYVYRVSHNYL